MFDREAEKKILMKMEKLNINVAEQDKEMSAVSSAQKEPTSHGPTGLLTPITECGSNPRASWHALPLSMTLLMKFKKLGHFPQIIQVESHSQN